MALSDFKQKYPEYAEIPDDELAAALYEQQGGGMGQEEFYQKIGHTTGQGEGTTPLQRYKQNNPDYAEVPDETLASTLYEQQGEDIEREEFYQKIGYTPKITELEGAITPTARPPERGIDPFAPTQQFTPEERATKEEEKEAAFFSGTPEEVMARIRAEKPIEEAFIDPITAVAGPMGFARQLGVKGLAAALTTSILAEPVVGAIQERVHEELGETPWYVQFAGDMAAGVAIGGATEAALRRAGRGVKEQLVRAGKAVTEENVNEVINKIPRKWRAETKKAFEDLKVQAPIGEGAEAPIREIVSEAPVSITKKSQDMRSVVKALKESNIRRGTMEEEFPEVPVVKKPIAKPGQVEKEAVEVLESKPTGPLTSRAKAFTQEAEDLQDTLVHEVTSKVSATKKTIPKADRENAVLISKYMAPSTVGGAVGGLGNGVDWEEYEASGQVIIDPQKMVKGAIYGAALAAGVRPSRKLAGAFGDAYTTFVDTKILNPLADVVNNNLINERARYLFGLDRSTELKTLLRQYNRKAQTVTQQAVELGKELHAVAPTKGAQRRLLQVMEGGVTASPSVAQKAARLNDLFGTLREQTKELNLLHYSSYDNMTRAERADLRNIIREAPSPGEAEIAQSLLNNYYHVGSAKKYSPTFGMKSVGLTGPERRIIKDEIKTLKKKSRTGNPEGDPALESTIAQLEDMLIKQTKGTLQTRGMTLNKGYTNQKQEIPQEVKKVMDNMLNASYRIARGAQTQTLDILKTKLFKDLAENENWILPTLARGERRGEIPANYSRLQGTEWGELSGRLIRKDVLADLNSVVEMRSDVEKLADSLLGTWKFGKAILNPVTHVRNFTSNAVLAWYGGLNPADLATYGSAAKALKEGRGNRFYNEAETWGLYNTSFVDTEVNDLRVGLESLRDGKNIQEWIRKAISAPAVAYDTNERLFKTALFINERNKGRSIEEAGLHAEEYLFNYRDIPPVVTQYKRWASPFFTFTYKAVPLLAKESIRKPWKTAAVMGSLYGATAYSASVLGEDPEKIAKEKEALSYDEMSIDKLPGGKSLRQLGQVLLPFKSEGGDNLYLNADDFMPWSSIGRSWGQSDIPFGDWLPSHPAIELYSAIKTNRDPFTGQDLIEQTYDTRLTIAMKYADYAFKQLLPSLAPPSGYGAEKLIDAFKNEVLGQDLKDWTGERKTWGGAILKSLLGVRLTPANQERLNSFRASRIKRLKRDANKVKWKTVNRFKKGEITKEEMNKELTRIHLLRADLSKAEAKKAIRGK